MEEKEKKQDEQLQPEMTEEQVANETAGQQESAEELETEEVDGLEKKVVDLENEISDLKDKNLRMMAEFDNYRRRTSQEKLNLKDATQDDMLREFLPLVDDFDRAMAAMEQAQDVDALREGMHLIYDKVSAYLDKYGVVAMPTQDVAFDVELHEAIAMLPAASEEQKGKILDCVKKGYTRNDKVLRHAQVAVGQ